MFHMHRICWLLGALSLIVIDSALFAAPTKPPEPAIRLGPKTGVVTPQTTPVEVVRRKARRISGERLSSVHADRATKLYDPKVLYDPWWVVEIKPTDPPFLQGANRELAQGRANLYEKLGERVNQENIGAFLDIHSVPSELLNSGRLRTTKLVNEPKSDKVYYEHLLNNLTYLERFGTLRDLMGSDGDLSSHARAAAIPRKVVIVDALPANEAEYRAVYSTGGEAPSIKQLEDMKVSDLDMARVAQDPNVRRARLRSLKDFDASESIVVFVGHNEAGLLKLPSGESFKLADLARRCAVIRKICVFLSCKAAEFVGNDMPAASKIIGIREAVGKAQAIVGFVGKLEVSDNVVRDPYELVFGIRDIVASSEQGKLVSILINGVSIAVIFLVSGDDLED